jgi:hypothetical protein
MSRKELKFVELVYVRGPPLWSSGPGFDSRRCQIFLGLERGPHSLVNNLRSYLEEIVAAPGLENRSYDRRDSLR